MLRKVTTQYGTIEGVPCGDPRITAFKGVPYAKPPVGELRWRAPQPPEPWHGVLRADRFAPMSVHNQPGLNMTDFYTKELNPTAYEYTMSEDCLYLNIYTPAKTAGDKLPVLYYIHGGGFSAGYSYEVEFDGERVARNDVIFVSVGYRLNVMGFFAHEELNDEPGQGNFGLLDQLAGMRWVRDNIAAFGGDPERITICGQSAGGMAVTCHLHSPVSKGAFDGAIIMSGGGLRSPRGRVGMIGWHTLEQAQAVGAQLLQALGVQSVAQARELPADVVVQTGFGRLPGAMMPWTPTVDGWFLKEDTRQAVMNGRIHDVPVMIGTCLGESLPNFAAPHLSFSGNLNTLNGFVDSVRANYGEYADRVLALCDTSSEEAYRRFIADVPSFGAFYNGTMSFARRMAQVGHPVYTYLFDHDIPGGDHAGSFHGSDMWFVFDSLGHSWRPFEGKHYDLARQVSSYWANFVKTGDPNGADRIGKPLPVWKKYTQEDDFVLCFQECPRRFEDPHREINDFMQRYCLERLE